MPHKYIIAGTDTDIGKTVFSAALASALNARYWKPIQSGAPTDTDTIKFLAPDVETILESYVLNHPLSPHRAAELDSIKIDTHRIVTPDCDRLIIELAGGLMVPITRESLQIDMIKDWSIPVILCARTGLGTLNHTLLSVESLRARDIPIHGVAFIGDDNPDNIKTIEHMGNVKGLGRLPMINDLNAETLSHAFQSNFDINDF